MITMKTKMKPKNMKCPYCGKTAVLRKASYVYKDRALEEYLYVCSGYPECDSYVGVHAGTFEPKGSLANGDLRQKRIDSSMPSGRTVSLPEPMLTVGSRISFA